MAGTDTLTSADAVHEPQLDLIKRGGGLTENRIVVPYTQLDDYRRKGLINKVGVAMHPPIKLGVPSDMQTEPALMDAGKYHKWWKQGYRPVGYVAVEPPPPRRWLRSMVDDSISKGEVIPEEMRPPGYMGDTFQVKRNIQQLEVDPMLGSTKVRPANSCSADGCDRHFKSEHGLKTHVRRAHG